MTELISRPSLEVYADAGNGTEVVLMAERFFKGIYQNIEHQQDRAVINEMLHWATPSYSFEDAAANYRLAIGINERGEGIEAVILQDSQPAGLTAVDLSANPTSPEVNIWLGPSYHRQGIGRRALRAFMDTTAKEHPEIVQFEYHILERNIPSQQMVVSLGGSMRQIECQDLGTPYPRSIAGGPEEDYYIWEVQA